MNRVISLRSAHCATVGHKNEYGHVVLSETPPPYPTFLGVTAHELRPVSQHDTWRFFITFQFGSRVTETFYGERARALWAEWKHLQFSKTKTKHKRNKKHGKSNASATAESDSQLALI